MSREEREYIETSLARENAQAPQFAGFREVLRSSVVWRLVLVYFFVQVGFYVAMWLFFCGFTPGLGSISNNRSPFLTKAPSR